MSLSQWGVSELLFGEVVGVSAPVPGSGCVSCQAAISSKAVLAIANADVTNNDCSARATRSAWHSACLVDRGPQLVGRRVELHHQEDATTHERGD